MGSSRNSLIGLAYGEGNWFINGTDAGTIAQRPQLCC